MSKYLTKLKKNPNNTVTDGRLNYKFDFTTMGCGNGYKEGLKHRFETNDSEDIPLLIDIINRFKLGTVITNVTNKSFEFESTNTVIQIFFFRICRYTRRINIRKVLEDTVMINKSGVTIQNAFLLAHYYNIHPVSRKIDYYNGAMDGFYDAGPTYLNKPFKTLKSFKEYLNPTTFGAYNYIYMYYTTSQKVNGKTLKDVENLRIKLFKLIRNKEFKKANRYLLSIFK